MLKPRTFRVACSSSLALAGGLGLLVATELALRGASQVVWMTVLFLVPALAFLVLLAVAVVYKRTLRRLIVHAAMTASEPQELLNVLDRVNVAEAWIGPLRLEQVRQFVRTKFDESRQAV